MKKITAIILIIVTLLGVGNLTIGIVNNQLINKLIKVEEVTSEIITEEIKITKSETMTEETKTTASENTIEEETTKNIFEEVSSLPVLEQTNDGRLVYNSDTEVYYLISDRMNIIVDEFHAESSDSIEDYIVKEDYIFFINNDVLYVWNMTWSFSSDVYSEKYGEFWPISNEFMNEIIANTKS